MQRMFFVLAASAAALTSLASPAVEAASTTIDPAQCFRSERRPDHLSDAGLRHQLQRRDLQRPATIITRSGAGLLHCAVKSVRALSPEEAKALPDKQRPC